MNRCEILSRSKWQAEDFACGSLSSKLPFLRRNNQVHRSSTAAPDSRRANRKRDNALKGNVYVHFLHPQFGFPDVYTYHRKVDEGLPCPFCGRNTISEEGLWVHLMTSKGDHLALVPNYADNGTFHIAMKNREIPWELRIQQFPSHPVGETEVIFWRAKNWHGKRYNGNGGAMLFCPPHAELGIRRGKKRNIDDRNDDEDDDHDTSDVIMTGDNDPETVKKAVSADECFVATNETGTTDGADRSLQYYKYNEYLVLSDALRIQKTLDPLPRHQYFHAMSRLPVTMGEWMLAQDRQGLPPSGGWRRRIEGQIRKQYSDMSQAEKQFTRRWNTTVQKHTDTNDTTGLAKVCHQMLQRFGADMPENIWTSHLLCLWEDRQLKRTDMLILMNEYHERLAARKTLLCEAVDKLQR